MRQPARSEGFIDVGFRVYGLSTFDLRWQRSYDHLIAGSTMQTTSHAALDIFKHDLAAFADDGEMTDHTAKELQVEFFGKSAAAAVLLTFSDMQAVHASANGNEPIIKGDGTTFHALSFSSEDKALAIHYPSGEGMLVAWSLDPKSDERRQVHNIHLVSLKPEIDTALMEEVRSRLGTGTETIADLTQLAGRVSRFGFPVDLADPYSDPRLLSDIVERIKANGVAKGCNRISDAWVIAITGPGPDRVSGRGVVNGYSNRFDVVERVASTFEHGVMKSYDLEDHAALVQEGRSLELFNSASAYAFERIVVGHLSEIEETVDIATGFSLGNGTVLAYNDTDVRIAAQRFDDKVVLVHNNIDRNEGNVFVTVVNKVEGNATSVDVYLAKDWDHDFAEANELDADEPLDMTGFVALIEEVEDNGDKLDEDSLLAELACGRPTAGLAYTYDIRARTLEVHPLAYRTSYLAYASTMLENDLDMLRKLRDGDYKGAGGAEFQSHEVGSAASEMPDRVKAKKYIEGLQASTSSAPTPRP
jgi:hypothetical protein